MNHIYSKPRQRVAQADNDMKRRRRAREVGGWGNGVRYKLSGQKDTGLGGRGRKTREQLRMHEVRGMERWSSRVLCTSPTRPELLR